jgi:hypothetical protein
MIRRNPTRVTEETYELLVMLKAASWTGKHEDMAPLLLDLPKEQQCALLIALVDHVSLGREKGTTDEESWAQLVYYSDKAEQWCAMRRARTATIIPLPKPHAVDDGPAPSAG